MRTPIAESIAGFGVNLGSITVGQGLDEGLWMSATSYNAPRKARTAFVKGTTDLRKGRIESAEKRLREAAALYPQYAAAWHGLGMALVKRGALEEACEALGHAIAADRDYAPPYSPLLRARADLGQWKQVSVIAARLQELAGEDEDRTSSEPWPVAHGHGRRRLSCRGASAAATASGVYRPRAPAAGRGDPYRQGRRRTGGEPPKTLPRIPVRRRRLLPPAPTSERTLSAWETASRLAPRAPLPLMSDFVLCRSRPELRPPVSECFFRFSSANRIRKRERTSSLTGSASASCLVTSPTIRLNSPPNRSLHQSQPRR